MASERQKRVARRLETDLVPIQTHIVAEEGYSWPQGQATRVVNSAGVVSERAKARAELRASAAAVGLTVETFAQSLKKGLQISNSGTQRLYAELFDLIDEQGKEQTIIVVLAAIRQTFEKLAPDKVNDALLTFGEELKGKR
jgi:hypothetical protein